MREQSQRGFTLIEVVLAIAVGLIIIAGVSVGYRYAKSAALMDNQRKDAAAIKTYIEQAIAAQQADPSGTVTTYQNLYGGPASLIPPAITQAQFGLLATKLGSLAIDPYTGAQRVSSTGVVQNDCSSGTPSSCITADDIATNCSFDGGNTSGSPYTRMDDFYGSNWANSPGAGSGVIYGASCSNYNDTFFITLGDGTTKKFFGWFVVEGDADGTIVVAEGGTEGTQQNNNNY